MGTGFIPDVNSEIPVHEAASTTETPTLVNQTTLEVTDMVFTLTSPAFEHKQSIPVKYTCKGDDVSPELIWNEPPAGTISYGLIVDDPDAPAGTWVHWVMYNIPAELRGLPEDVPGKKEVEWVGNEWSQ